MQPHELIGQVAARRVGQVLDDNPVSRTLLGILGLSPAAARAIAREISSLPTYGGRIEAFIHPALVNGSADEIGNAVVSDRTATWHRNHAGENVRLTLFSVPALDVKSVEQSLAHVERIDDDWLMNDPGAWASIALGDDALARDLAHVLKGLARSDVVSDAIVFAEYALRVAKHVNEDGLILSKAVRRALPALRLPRDAGDPKAKMEASPVAAEQFFRKVKEEAGSALFLKDRDGEPLNPSELKERLRQLEESGDIEADSARILRDLLDDPDASAEWSEVHRQAANVSWDEAERLFGGSKKKTRARFGEETLELFRNLGREDDLTEEEKEFLGDLTRDSVRPGDAHDTFFQKHRERLTTDHKLYKRWERLVFRKPIETPDLPEGLLRLAFRARQDADEMQEPRLYIRLRGGEKADFWKEKNTKLCRLLRDRWRGLPDILKPFAVLDFGRCWEDWEGALFTPAGQQDQESVSKTATEFEFEAYLVEASAFQGSKPDKESLKSAARAQMTWRPHPDSMMTALPMDLALIATDEERTPTLLTASVSANRYDRHGAVQAVDLSRAATLSDVDNDSNGRLANPRLLENRVARRCADVLERLLNEGVMTADQTRSIVEGFSAFQKGYGKAVRAFVRPDGLGVADPALTEQGERYGDLLMLLRQLAQSQVAVHQVWDLVLRIGVITVDTARPTAIVAGWNPLRLAEIGAKARLLTEGIRRVVTSPDDLADEIGNYIEMLLRDLGRTYYADVGLSADGKTMLMETRRIGDMSLLEPPTFGGEDDPLADAPADETVEKFEKVSEEYLKLRPHEVSNFSVVLLDAESEDLPVLIANSMARRLEGQANLRCDLVLTHQKPLRLRRIYENQNRRIGYELDSAMTSEAARNFLSRLRVGIVSPENLAEGTKSHDVVVLQDVIARRAEVRWAKSLAGTDLPKLASHVPSSKSRRKPFRMGDTTSGVYLTSPGQPAAAQAYLDVLHDVLEGSPSEPENSWLPMQEVEFRSGAVSEALEYAHRLGNWVMTFDRLADRRLISSSGRRIIRYFSDPRSDHNVIVSAEIDERDLGERLRGDLSDLLPNASNEEIDELLKAVHRNSADLSGAIVMRGAHTANHAYELLGLVLAQREIRLLLDATSEEHRTAWFFLDDFHTWLDLSQTRADIMAVDMAVTDTGPRVRIVIGEAKFVSEAGLGEQQRRSAAQLEATYDILRKRLISEHGTLDRSSWLGRIADLVLEHIPGFDQIGGIPAAEWISRLRTGRVNVDISGHSLVFVHDMNAASDGQPHVPDQDQHDDRTLRRPLAQWTFGRPQIAVTLRAIRAEDSESQIHVPSAWPDTGFGKERASAKRKPRTEATSRREVETRPEPGENEMHEAALGESAQRLPPVDPGSLKPPVETSRAGWKQEVFDAVRRMSRPADQQTGENWLAEAARNLQRALQKEKIDAPIEGSRLTPNTGLVFVGGQTLTVGWLERNRTDLMTRYGIEIVRITPMPGRIAVALKRPERAILHLADAWLRRNTEPKSPELNMALVLGEKEDDGDIFYLSLANDFVGVDRAAPHTLVSGTTGSGKGILATNLLLDVCAFNDPSSVEVYLIDPKHGVDYNWARRLPHLKAGIVDDKEEAVELLKRLVRDMEDRYARIAEAGCANIDQYNRRHPGEHMPRVVIFFDEVANWMQDDDFKDEVEGVINEIATKSRAAGLHLFMIYQRADNQVMTMQLRTNLGNKLILKLGDEGSSRIALGEKGAERLLGKGHLIAKLGSSDEKIFGQVPFIDEDDVVDLADAIRRAWA